MKTNFASRLFSLLTAVLLLLCMFPTSVFAADTKTATYYYSLNDGTNMGTTVGNDYLPSATSKSDNPVSEEMTWEAGGKFTPSLPTQTTFNGTDGNTYTLSAISVRIAHREYAEDGSSKNVLEWFPWKEGDEPIAVHSGAINVAVYYKWTIPEDDTPSGTEERPYLTNFIFSVDRTVAQGGSDLTPKPNDAGTDVYIVKEDQSGMKSGLTLTYNTSMDMTKLGVFDGVNYLFQPNGEAWQVLLDWAPYISDTTYVDLHFVFDEKIIMSTLDTSEADLKSDMFVLVDNDPFEVNGKELIVHCRWDSEKANEKLDKKGTLDNMIYFTGLEIGLDPNWNGADTITITNTGKVDGWMWGLHDANGDGDYSDSGDIDINMEIRGGDATDQFILTVTDKTKFPGMDKTVQTGTNESEEPIWGNATTAAAGDEVNFKLTTNVPQNLADYVVDDPQIMPLDMAGGNYTLTIHDQMDSAFESMTTPVVTLDRDGTASDVVLDADTHQYTYTAATDDGCTFHIEIDLIELYNSGVITMADIEGATPITVTYTATLKEGTSAGTYYNTAWVSYPQGNTEQDKVPVDTYGIEIFKYDQANNSGLAGAQFALYGDDSVTVADDGTVTVNGGADPIWTGTSGTDGHVTIQGLDAGTYYLVETKAPDGYVRSSTPLKIEIPEKADAETNLVHVQFANSKTPLTGGTGTMMFTIGGAAILAAAGALFVISRRPRKEQEF